MGNIKGIKLRVPPGEHKEAHAFMRSLGYDYILTEGDLKTAFLYGKNRQLFYGINEAIFERSPHREVFLPILEGRKRVKLRVPEGKSKEAHEYMQSLGYAYTFSRKGVWPNFAFLYGGAYMRMGHGDSKKAFDASDAEEIFMPSDEPVKERSDGSTASYYELPEGATQLQDLISHRDMNAQVGEIVRACYRYGLVQHSDQLRDIKKIIFYANAELRRLEKLAEGLSGDGTLHVAKAPEGTVITETKKEEN